MDGSSKAETTHKIDLSAIDIQISGMTCSGCVGRVERALSAIDGVELVAVNLASEKAHIEAKKGHILDPELLASISTEAGYPATYITDDTDLEEHVSPADRRQFILLVLSIILTTPFMVQMILMPTPFNFTISPITQLILASLVQFVPGSRFYGPAWRALKAKSGNMDMLIVLGTSATWGLSTFLIWTKWSDLHAHELYFEASTSVITLVLVGKYLETKARRNTASAIKSLMSLRPNTARIRADGEDREVPLKQLRVGDVLVIKPGERIPADGEIIEGISHVDESLITGESLPIMKDVGSSITGGAINGEGLLITNTNAIGSDSKLAQIIKLVETAQVNKPPIQKLVDKIASYFVPFIIVISALTFTGWIYNGASIEDALIYAATVLVIACPCALGLATPTAIMVGTGAAAKSGILIRDMEALEHARLINCVVFDKTGTLTEGKPQVVGIYAPDQNKPEFMRRAASAQQGSEHPLSKALIGYAKTHDLDLPPVLNFTSLPGRGISAQVEGANLFIGSRRLMHESEIMTLPMENQADSFENDGNTLIWVGDASSKKAIGVIAIGDTLRPSAIQTITRLKSQGMETVLLSGDNTSAAQKAGTEIGMSRVIAEVLPEEKAAIITQLKADGYKVAMVGDGVNDAPALATADLGIAMGSGTDVAMETAGITLMRADLILTVDAVDVSRATYGKIKQNLFWAFVYNVVAIPLAVMGVLSPVIAGAAMAMSSVSVVLNSLLLKRWKGKGGSS